MKFIGLTLLATFIMVLPGSAQSIYEFSIPTIEGTETSLSEYQGKVILIVNVASRCGLTPQYEDLQALYEEFADQGLVILGFPANDFMNQEPGTNAEIAAFCEEKYSVTFPMFSKISVKGSEQHALYQYLEAETGKRPTWNFHKYLVDRSGESITSISPQTRVTEPQLRRQIEELLQEE